MFWDKYAYLCNTINKSPSKVALELGITSGTISGWKKGRMPQDRRLAMVADYFGVTAESLISDGEIEVIKQPEKVESFLDGLTEENKEKVIAFAKYLLSEQE